MDIHFGKYLEYASTSSLSSKNSVFSMFSVDINFLAYLDYVLNTSSIQLPCRFMVLPANWLRFLAHVRMAAAAAIVVVEVAKQHLGSDSVLPGRKIWLVITSPSQAKELNASFHRRPFYPLHLQLQDPANDSLLFFFLTLLTLKFKQEYNLILWTSARFRRNGDNSTY